MRTFGRALLVGLLYLGAARLSVVLHDLAGLGAVFWPGAGVTVTALLVSPRRMWPALLTAVAVAEFGHDLATGFGIAPSLWWSAANVAEPLGAAWLIQWWQADRFDDLRGVARFVAAAFAAPVLGGLVGAAGTSGTVSELPYVVTTGQWIVGDGLGILTVAPFGLLLVGRIPTQRLRSTEGILAVAAVLLAATIVFGLRAPAVVTAHYLVLLPVIWASLRLRMAGAAISVFIAAQLANGWSALGRGPFVEVGQTVQSTAQLQLFLATLSITALLLASRTVESETFQDLAAGREQLIAAVSHELRTPLTPIVGFSELLVRRDGDLPPDVSQAAEIIHRNGRHLSVLVEDLLHASRARRGDVGVHPEPVHLVTFFADLLAGRQSDAIDLDIDAAVVATVDPTHLTQIVTNLLDNAARHGRPPVRLAVRPKATVVEISVTDHGDGVPGWFVSQLFDEFAQAGREQRSGRLGLGLGLPIARSLARANGGDLHYRRGTSGACFTLTLPAATVGPDTAALGTPHDRSPDTAVVDTA